MALTTLDANTALVLIDLQHGIVAPPAVPRSGAEEDRMPANFAVLVDELGAQDTDIRVTKHQWGAFHGTDLDTQLRRRGVTQIVLAGLVTSRGVDTTAREAYAHNYSVAFAVDAMADR